MTSPLWRHFSLCPWNDFCWSNQNRLLFWLLELPIISRTNLCRLCSCHLLHSGELIHSLSFPIHVVNSWQLQLNQQTWSIAIMVLSWSVKLIYSKDVTGGFCSFVGFNPVWWMWHYFMPKAFHFSHFDWFLAWPSLEAIKRKARK